MEDDVPEAGQTEADMLELQLRQLALVDRVLGLEAEVARLSASSPYAQSVRLDVERVQGELRAAHDSATWMIGSAVLAPVRMLRRRGKRKK